MRKIMLVDDHPVVRLGLQELLAAAFPGVEFGHASDAGEAFSLVSEGRWDLVVLDINMPGRSGLDLLRDLRQSRREIPVFVLSVYPEEQFAVRALKAGAAGYMTKDRVAHELVAAVRKVIAGGTYVSPELAQKWVFRMQRDEDMLPHERLSDRELEILQLISAARSVSDIAEELGLSVKTVSTHRRHILDKMGLRNTSELMRYAIEHRLAQ